MNERILFAVNSFPPRVGGLEKHVENLAKALVKNGHSATVVTIGNKSQDVIIEGVRVISIPGKLNIGSVFSFPPLGTTNFIKDFVKQEKITVISVHTRFFPMTWLGVKVAQKTHTASVLTEHGSNYVSGVPPVISLFSRIIDWTLGRRALKNSDIVLGISDGAVQFVKKLSGRIPILFQNAVDTEFWQESKQLSPNNLVFVGRVVRGKGWDDAIACFDRIATEYPKLNLHIFGDGPETQKLDELLTKAINKKRIIYHGSQPQEVIREYLTGSVLVNPTTLSEGFQTTLIEAAVAQARIVTYPVPGVKELQSAGSEIFVANSPQELSKAISCALAIKPTKLPLQSIENWGWKLRATQYIQIVGKRLGPRKAYDS